MPTFFGDIRRNQVLFNYGPGSLVNFRDEGAVISVIMSELQVWNAKAAKTKVNQVFHDTRLLKSLHNMDNRLINISYFRLPPIQPENKNNNQLSHPHLQANIFPRMMLCGGCRSLKFISNWDQADYRPARYCAKCSKEAEKLIYVSPSRFVVICERGHIDDFPYAHWLNRENSECETNHKNLKLDQTRGLGLSGLELSCYDCDAKVSMNGIFDKKQLSYRCRAKKPWLIEENKQEDNEECDCLMQAVQRNSQSVWTGMNMTSIYVPPWNSDLQEKLGEDEGGIPLWEKIEAHRDDLNRTRQFIHLFIDDINKILEFSDISKDDFFDMVKKEKELENKANVDLKVDEYNALIDSDDVISDRNFQMRNIEPLPEKLTYLLRLKEILRLKEVRALYAFKRGNGEPHYINNKVNWLPASEVFGEGIFIEFDGSKIKEVFEENEFTGLLQEEERALRKRYILLHSLSHFIMKAICIESGYSLSSIRERIYSENDQNGILIYTSSSDSQGTLGGLSRLANKKRIESVLNRAFQLTSICSNDPLCGYGTLSVHEISNHIACHSCILLPETSCEHFNQLLSRDLAYNFLKKYHA